MASITLKISSLIIRTLSKPIANQIKAQAREHERFRRICISFAQTLHRADMRLRLGLLHTNAQIERQATRGVAEAHAKKRKHQVATVKTEAQVQADEAAAAREQEKNAEPPKPPPTPRIRPLSDAKAIDTGANFISEAFLFMVAGGLIVFESWRSRRKETSRREDVAERLAELEESERTARLGLIALEKEVLKLRAQVEKKTHKDLRPVLPEAIRKLDEEEEPDEPPSLFGRFKANFWWLQKAAWRKNSSESDSTISTSPGASSTSQPKSSTS
ncbi:OPA3 domain-containing protein [Coccidioides immitis RS]|uniref:OPA3 domain-containing protein n=4 Tax=Coccidioides immitis TaxID=5501 RepID=J3K659_COCIM|nr:OPA3 domain-containing protein [Coccidioides immitis RS]EAS30026.3 OPA3 domain-containing protein [Coccidioides immitis RS]KMP06984.1 hypothetical protein CIRG_06665 [Coccidioides immitis RMSCC 2394]KMU86706.1 hypothetical protein CIHG_04495 [Coccidioides immitis H538.4]TPX22182.1 hypothetical protein DIZ76_014047 [Coccidioides immitis]